MKKVLFYSGMASCFIGVSYIMQWIVTFVFVFAYVFAGRSSGDDGKWWINIHRNNNWLFVAGVAFVFWGALWVYINRKKISDFFYRFFDEDVD